MCESNKHLPCEDKINQIDKHQLLHWLGSLAVQRLEKKANDIEVSLHRNNMDWEETFYQHLAKNFGFKINAVPFEMLAKSIPLKYLLKQQNNLFRIEAMLLGQSGLLEKAGSFADDYVEKLKKEYSFMQIKYRLQPLDAHLWKFMRIRPMNFPTVRIAQFSSLINSYAALFASITDAASIKQLKKLFAFPVSDYWLSHYHFTKTTRKTTKNTGNEAIENILINTVAPFLFVYGKKKQKDECCERALELLESLKAETNAVIVGWKKLGIDASSAFYSQALLQLKNEFCMKKNCLNCHIMLKIINL